ncbi:MAG: long-chain fatty acid--CoA ligase [Acidobacteriota bacterium]|nr:long-chain fatty acid--CoA ligase [Acidobacteriota bacterium]
MNLRTLNDVFFSIIQRDQPRVIVYRKDEAWIPISAQELRLQIMRLSQALLNWGIRKGDRIAILSENRPEWAVADFASLLVGAVVVPIYATLTAEQTAYVLRNSGARIVFASSEKQLKKICEIRAQTSLEKIVVMDSAPLVGSDIVLMQDIAEDVTVERKAEIDALAHAVGPEDLATIIYTSGTTGTPKGAMLTHGNMAANLSCSLRGFDLNPGDVSLSFLPLSHVTARHVDYAMLYHGVTICYVPFLDSLPRALNEIRPTILVSVPRLYEKIHTQVELKAKKFPKRQIYRWALSVGKAYRNETLAGRLPTSFSWNLASRLLFSKVRAGLGGRVRIFISGGAPLGRELAEWYANVGIRIHEGYGLTETSPVIAVNSPEAHKIGTVGKPLANIEARIADDGEILVRGPSIFPGYWNKPDETQAVFNGDWFKTGDIGNLDADGFLSVTDRKKDLIKTSGGKFIAPQPIENSLKHNAFVAEAVVLGDKHKFPAALISPNFVVLEDWARNNGVAFSSRQELVADGKTQALYEAIVDVATKDLARFEKLKKVILVADEFTSDNGLLTASMKMRRRVVEERYRQRIADMYARAEESGPAS